MKIKHITIKGWRQHSVQSEANAAKLTGVGVVVWTRRKNGAQIEARHS